MMPATRVRWLVCGCVAALLVAVAFVALPILRPPAYEQIILINDSVDTLRVDQCSVDNQVLQPGPVPKTIDVSASLTCPVYIYQGGATTYLGCLIIRRQSQHDRRVPILANTRAAISEDVCDNG